MSTVNKLVYAIIRFLKSQLNTGKVEGEAAEGVEVGIQCLEAAYSLSEYQGLDVSASLQEIFQNYLTESEIQRKDATPEEKAAAENIKVQGNSYMIAGNYTEAAIYYTKAINLDPKNAVYYSNRAAALNKLGKYESVLQDCHSALQHNPQYAKPYSRMGLAYTLMKKYQDAVFMYQKAVDIDPTNENYKLNLKLAQDSLAKENPTSNNPLQNIDLSVIFTNPSLLNMASQMLSNPTMQNMMSNILSGNINQGGAGIEVLLQASHQLAQHMENENPALVQQLRRHMTNGEESAHGSDGEGDGGGDGGGNGGGNGGGDGGGNGGGVGGGNGVGDGGGDASNPGNNPSSNTEPSS